MHPLTDLSIFSDDQIEQRIADLSRKYFVTANPQIHSQLELMIDECKQELTIRSARKKLEQNNNPDDNSLDNLINIS